jgi:pimeloyl-ACP methyl ester carboxylesterase
VGAHLSQRHARRRGPDRAALPAAPAGARPKCLDRAALFAQFSAHPGKLPAALALDEARSLAACPSFDPLLRDLARGPAQAGAPPGTIRAPLAIGWGRRDRVTLPAQAARAARAFPDARLHWFPDCGHFPQWDRPEETVRLVLKTVGR